MRREAFKNDGVVPNQFNAPDLLVWDTTRYTDWQKAFVGGTARYTDGQVSTSGGTTLVQYLIGGNYHKQTTVFPGNFSSQNGGAHFSITGVSINQKLRTVLTGSYAASKTNLPGLDLANRINLEPDAPPAYNTDGSLNWANSTWENPYVNTLKILDAQTNNLLSNVDVSYRLLPRLVLKANLGYNELRINTFFGVPIASFDPKYRNLVTATGSYTDTKNKSWIFEPQATYTVPIGEGTLNVLVGATLLGNKTAAQRLIAFDIKDDALIRNLAAATSYISNNTGSNYKYAAFFGRMGYNLQDKYLVNFTLRRDGSSRFGPRKQFATFSALAAGWIFSQENFVKSALPFLSYGKLRVSYGTVGNDQIGDYAYLDRYEYQEQPYQGVKGLRQLGLFNADFAWELTRKAEAGIETGFLKDSRILLMTSYYRNRSTNQLISYPLPSMLGAPSITGNLPAVLQNAGWEFVLTTKNIQTRYFEWSSAFNISVGRNKLVSYSGTGDISAREGHSLSEIHLFKSLGVDPATGAYLFQDGEGHPAPAERAIQNAFLNLEPTYFGGFQNSFRFKGFRLDVFFQYVKQLGTNGLFDFTWVPGTRRNQSIEVLNRWQQPGDYADIQRFSQNGRLKQGFQSTFFSDRGYSDASFIRCKNVAFSWQLPDNWKQKMHLNNCRIYLQGQNLFTITKYRGWDPETKSVNAIPPLRVLTGGIQLVF
jgi:TonB-linked SusC/RagA family outer membrane protein